MSKLFADIAGATTANDGVTLEVWMQPLRSRLAGATEALILSELMATVREFYLQSNAWREQIGPYSIYGGRDLVFLNPVDNYSNVNYIWGVWMQLADDNRVDLKPQTVRVTNNQTGEPTHYQCADPYVVRLWPMPEVNMGMILYVDCSLVPLPDATRLPNIAASHHYDAILDGAMARMLMMPNKPWTNPILGLRLSQTFRRNCIQFRAQAAQGYAKHDPAWKFPSFA